MQKKPLLKTHLAPLPANVCCILQCQETPHVRTPCASHAPVLEVVTTDAKRPLHPRHPNWLCQPPACVAANSAKMSPCAPDCLNSRVPQVSDTANGTEDSAASPGHTSTNLCPSHYANHLPTVQAMILSAIAANGSDPGLHRTAGAGTCERPLHPQHPNRLCQPPARVAADGHEMPPRVSTATLYDDIS